MSYCRFSMGLDPKYSPKCDIYIFESSSDPPNSFRCCACFLTPDDQPDPVFLNPLGIYRHVLDHKAAGHAIPRSTIRMFQEMALQAPAHLPWDSFRDPAFRVPLLTFDMAFTQYMAHMTDMAYNDQSDEILLKWLKNRA